MTTAPRIMTLSAVILASTRKSGEPSMIFLDRCENAANRLLVVIGRTDCLGETAAKQQNHRDHVDGAANVVLPDFFGQA